MSHRFEHAPELAHLQARVRAYLGPDTNYAPWPLFGDHLSGLSGLSENHLNLVYHLVSGLCELGDQRCLKMGVSMGQVAQANQDLKAQLMLLKADYTEAMERLAAAQGTAQNVAQIKNEETPAPRQKVATTATRVVAGAATGTLAALAGWAFARWRG